MNRVNQLFGIKYPIIQGGMVWCRGWKLCAAVSNSGGLGLIGSGSMYSDVLEDHILKCKKATINPFGVNIPLLYPHGETHIQKVKVTRNYSCSCRIKLEVCSKIFRFWS